MSILNKLINSDLSNDNLTFICRSTLNYYKVKNTLSRVNELINNNLEYPSILALIDTLKHYGIACAAFRKNEHEYANFETPFICSIQQHDWSNPYLTLVTSVDLDTIHYLDPLKKVEKVIPVAEFIKMDKNIILLMDGTNISHEIDYKRSIKLEKTRKIRETIILLIIFAIWFAIVAYNLTKFPSPHSIYGTLSFLFLTIGTIFSILLLWKEVDSHTPFLKEVCGGNGRKFNCDAVLNSKGASILGLNWSVIGFSYFITLLISQSLFGLTNASFLPYWSMIQLLAVPYTIYSIYYQWKIVKQWCPLCLVVQGALFLSAVSSLIYIIFFGLQFSTLFPLFTLSSIGISVLGLVSGILPILKTYKESAQNEKNWKRLRFNRDIFYALLHKETAIQFQTDQLGIQIGNPNAKNEIIKVCNPYCGPCSQAHPFLSELIQYDSDIKVRIIFTATGNNEDFKTAPVSLFLAIQEQLGIESVTDALDKWYRQENKDYQVFASSYQIDEKLEEQKEKINAMREWCDLMKIRATPTYFVNGYELPDLYQISELKHIL